MDGRTELFRAFDSGRRLRHLVIFERPSPCACPSDVHQTGKVRPEPNYYDGQQSKDEARIWLGKVRLRLLSNYYVHATIALNATIIIIFIDWPISVVGRKSGLSFCWINVLANLHGCGHSRIHKTVIDGPSIVFVGRKAALRFNELVYSLLYFCFSHPTRPCRPVVTHEFLYRRCRALFFISNSSIFITPQLDLGIILVTYLIWFTRN